METGIVSVHSSDEADTFEQAQKLADERWH